MDSSHQWKIKQARLEEDLKNVPYDVSNLTLSNLVFFESEFNKEINDFIKRYEWLGTSGNYPKWCFGAMYRDILCGVVLINEPNAYSKLLGEKTKKYEALIQRGATISWAPKNLGSALIMYACRTVVSKTRKRLFIGYSDPSASELGIIYQACNFDYLGMGFGTKKMYKHSTFKAGQKFSSQTLKRTSTFRKWLKEEKQMPLDRDWLSKKGYKDVSKIPREIMNEFYAWGKKIISESEEIEIPSKGKYALVLGRDKREQKELNKLKTYKCKTYPKRSSFNQKLNKKFFNY